MTELRAAARRDAAAGVDSGVGYQSDSSAGGYSTYGAYGSGLHTGRRGGVYTLSPAGNRNYVSPGKRR